MLKVPSIFSDHMVLQQNKPVAIFGTATPNAAVTVSVAPLNLVAAAIANAKGQWQATLPPTNNTDICTVTIQSGEETLCFSDVVYGEVWLAGGQSNMEFFLENAKNGKEELEHCADSHVRCYQVPRNTFVDDNYHQALAESSWETASPANTGKWSAVAYLAAKELAQKLHVTVGIIGCNFGGSSVSCWIPESDLASHAAGMPYLEDYRNATAGKTEEEMVAEYDAYVAYHTAWERKMQACYQEDGNMPWQEIIRRCGENRYPGPMGIKNPLRPSGMYHTMLKTVAPYTLQGFFYYQGEQDDCRPKGYSTLLSILIHRWRREFQDANLPFLFVQLPMYTLEDMPEQEQWSKLREAQLNVFRTVKNTGIAVTLDCGEYGNIHPVDKHPVAHRLALLARREVYGEAVSAYGPLYRTSYRSNNTMIIHFDYAEDGLVFHGAPEGFELCDKNGVWHCAKAEIHGSMIWLHSDDVAMPIAARYAWVNYGAVSLYGKNGIPASPFRTNCLALPLATE